MGRGAMQGVTCIQRVATLGGIAPATPCAAGNLGAKQIVKYQADYTDCIFYKAMDAPRGLFFFWESAAMVNGRLA